MDVIEDANKDEMRRAVDRLKSRIHPNSVVMLVLGRPRELHDPGRCHDPEGTRRAPRWPDIESVLDVMKQKGARAQLAVIDASRRNPYERRFRALSHGLAPIAAPDNGLMLSTSSTELSMVRAVWNGKVIAGSDRTEVVEGNHHFSPEHLRSEYLAPSDQHTTCAWKGAVSYYHIVVDGAQKSGCRLVLSGSEACSQKHSRQERIEV